MRAVTVDTKKCTGCRTCEVVCSLRHYAAIWPERSAIRINESYPRLYRAVVCRQCGKPACLPACPVGALSVKDGIVVVDQKACNGCAACVKACPFKAMFLDRRSALAVKCDLCGGQPACILRCPDEAISLRDFSARNAESSRPKVKMPRKGG